VFPIYCANPSCGTMPLRVGSCVALFDSLGVVQPRPCSATEVASAFLSARPASTVPLAQASSAFPQVQIRFQPRAQELQEQELHCENDVAVCNRECEKLFGERVEEMEEPCKLAVDKHFGSTSVCFPSVATVQERQRGRITIDEITVGDEIAAERGEPSRVVALLHNNNEQNASYLKVSYNGGELVVSPQHLVRARICPDLNVEGSHFASKYALGLSWTWLPAEDLRPGDELEDANGGAVGVEAVSWERLRGAHAPLTASGALLVEGILCSCYAPPVAWCLPHQACHSVCMPLRVIDRLRITVEHLSRLRGAKQPLLTVETMWMLPTPPAGAGLPKGLHPYAAVLLLTAQMVQRVMEATTTSTSVE